MLSPIDRFFSSGLRLSHLRLLVALADLKQVTRVASAFHVTQPAISKQLSEIEQALGASITYRSGKALYLTDVGAVLAIRGKEILRQVGLAQKDVAALLTGTAGRVTLGSVTAISPSLVSKSIMSFRMRAPSANVKFIEAPLDKLLDTLRSGESELVLARSRRKEVDDLQQETLYTEPFVFVAGPSNGIATQGPVTMKDLSECTWLVPLKGTPSYQALARLMEEEGIDINNACVESSSVGLNFELMASGSFVSILPLSLARGYAARGRISLMDAPALKGLGEVVLYRRGDLQNPAALLLAECLKEESAEMSLRFAGSS